jgi:hypothetical protein
MKDYLGTVKATAIWLFIGGAIVYWGISNSGIVRIIIGLLIIFVGLTSTIQEIKYIRELNRWKKDNEGKLIFFYPCKKLVQKMLEEQIVPFLPENCLRVYYEGPFLMGDIKRSIISSLMAEFKFIIVNRPSIFKIVNNELHFEGLSDLINISKMELDIFAIKNRIEKIASV